MLAYPNETPYCFFPFGDDVCFFPAACLWGKKRGNNCSKTIEERRRLGDGFFFVFLPIMVFLLRSGNSLKHQDLVPCCS